VREPERPRERWVVGDNVEIAGGPHAGRCGVVIGFYRGERLTIVVKLAPSHVVEVRQENLKPST